MAVNIEQVKCDDCGVGIASGLGAGGFCPFLERSYGAGEMLYAEGDPVHHVWLLKKGAVVLYRKRVDEQGPGRVRTVRFAGGFIGLEGLVSPAYIDTARASGDVVLCMASLEGFEQWLGPKGTPSRTALEASVRAMLMDLPPRAAADGSAAQRVAEWLACEGPGGGTLHLPRRVIADLLGMRPETLSRALSSLASRGAIAVSRTDLHIVDQEALSDIARTG